VEDNDMTENPRAVGGVRWAVGLIVVLGLWAAIAAPAVSAGQQLAQKGRLSASSYYNMKPFVLPIMKDGRVREQFNLVVALELADDDKRSEVYHLTAPLRDAMYLKLYQMVTFRRRGSPNPHVDAFKKVLYEVAREIAGPDLVTALVVQQAFKRRAR
jgi:hypothetical protein